jgi:hypothetical protein
LRALSTPASARFTHSTEAGFVSASIGVLLLQLQPRLGTQQCRKTIGQGLLGVAIAAAPFAKGILPRSANCGKEGVGATAAKGGQQLLWTSWRNYPKVTEAGTQYAQIGERLWTQHAVDRMQPGGLGAPAGQIGAGRSIAPNFVEDVIRIGDTTQAIVNGVTRTMHTSGTVQVVTEQGGRIVITVNPFYGG